MTTYDLGKTTLQAIQSLRPSGEKSFEKLTAMLLSQLTGVPIRLCGAGYQAGADALAEIPFAVEDKRYQSGSLDLRELQGELVAAAERHPDLQLWVLVATVELEALKYEALRKTGETLGVGILVLDDAAAQPHLPTVSSIAALSATNPATTLHAIGAQDWLDSHAVTPPPPVAAVATDLDAIRTLPRFTEWVEQLRAKLTGLPLWRFITERQNRRIAKIIERDTLTHFGTAFDPGQVVPHTVKAKLREWLATAIQADEPELAVVIGERFDGKTWGVLDWLREQLATLPLPVFFIGSNRGIDSAKSLEDHILEDIHRLLGSFERHARSMVRRQRDIKTGSAPWCLVILDGLNEYGLHFDKCLAHIEQANARSDLDRRPCAVLATVRQHSWQDLDSRVSGKKCVIPVGPYDDTEFQAALRLRGLPDGFLASLPARVRPMIQRPRYFDLVIKHRDQLGSYTAVTPDVLHWLDACDKIARSRPTPERGWDPESYQEVLKNLAAHYSIRGSLNLTAFHDAIGTLRPDPRTALNDLKSEGVLVHSSTGYTVSSGRLALGMGMYLFGRVVRSVRAAR